jgi:hypothetical protein
VRGDDPLKIAQRAGHTDFATTQGYIRRAEELRAGYGETFPPLPIDLYACSHRIPIGSNLLQVSDIVVEAPGIELAEKTMETTWSFASFTRLVGSSWPSIACQ